VFWDLDGWLEVDDDEVSTLVHALNAFFTKSTTRPIPMRNLS
jgi:hypothetical protein